MRKNKAKSKRRKAGRRRWFIFKDGRKAFKEYFRSEGVARAFIRWMGNNEQDFDFIKKPIYSKIKTGF